MSRFAGLWSRIRLPILAIFVALLAGAVVIMLSDLEVLGTIAHDPIGGLGMGLGRVVGAYGSLLRGAFGDPAAFGKIGRAHV